MADDQPTPAPSPTADAIRLEDVTSIEQLGLHCQLIVDEERMARFHS